MADSAAALASAVPTRALAASHSAPSVAASLSPATAGVDVPVSPTSLSAVPLPVEPMAGGVAAFVGTLLFGWAFFAFTAQVAASFFLGDAPWRRAAVVGLVPAAVTVALIRYPPALILLVAVGFDAVAIRLVYRVSYRTVALMTVLHVGASIALSVPLTYLLALIGTAPV